MHFIDEGSLEGSEAEELASPGVSSPASMQWYDFLEDSLASWAEQAQGYRLMHEKAYSHYNKISFNLTIPAIILSTLTGVANFGQESLSPYLGSDAPLYIGVLSIIAAIMSTIAKYVRADEKAETHRSAMVAWDKLYRTIVTELTQPRDNRTEPQEFLISYREERHRLSEQSPTIPYKIRAWFRHEFSSDFAKGNISPPNILSIGNVEVYRENRPLAASCPKFPATPRNSVNGDDSSESSTVSRNAKSKIQKSKSPGGFKNFGIQTPATSNLSSFFSAAESKVRQVVPIPAVQTELMEKVETSKAQLEARTQEVQAQLRAKADALQADLDTKADAVQSQLRARADALQADLDTKADAVQSQLHAKADAVQTQADILERRMMDRAEEVFRNAGKLEEDLSDLAHDE
jgi:hypothetical protein